LRGAGIDYCGDFNSIGNPASLCSKVLSHLCHNLVSGHLVNRLNDNAAIEALVRKPRFELSLCFTRPEQKDGLCATKRRYHFLVVPKTHLVLHEVLLV